MRTGLEPNKSSDIFSSTKTTTESSKSNDWLGLKGESSDEDVPPPRVIQKTEPVITTLVKKIPIAPVQEAPLTIPELPKKSVLDDLLEDDRRALKEKSTRPPTIISNNAAQGFWLDEQTTPNKRLATAVIPKTSLFTDNQQMKSSIKPLSDTKTDYGIFNICFLKI
jgi:hypothetical protein